jgi:hypothetical protein
VHYLFVIVNGGNDGHRTHDLTPSVPALPQAQTVMQPAYALLSYRSPNWRPIGESNPGPRIDSAGLYH